MPAVFFTHSSCSGLCFSVGCKQDNEEVAESVFEVFLVIGFSMTVVDLSSVLLHKTKYWMLGLT